MKVSEKYDSEKCNLISGNDELSHVIRWAKNISIEHIAISWEHEKIKPIWTNNGEIFHDKRKIIASTLYLSMEVVTDYTFDFEISITSNTSLNCIQELLNIYTAYIGYELKDTLFTIWSLGLKEPINIWDIKIYERGESLGKININKRIKCHTSKYQFKELKSYKNEHLNLHYICLKHNIHKYAILTRSISKIYKKQKGESQNIATLKHFQTIEMPWITTNARMEWNGVKVDRQTIKSIIEAYEIHWPPLEKKLNNAGIYNINRDEEIRDFFDKQGILHLFQTQNGYSFDKSTLKELKHRDPCVELIETARQIQSMRRDLILNTHLIASDGRIHPTHIQLATETGRQSSIVPNVLGLNKILRNVIIPADGYSIGEVDLSQIEIGVAAAYVGDQNLIEAFNTGDVYSDMAKKFYRSELSKEDLDLLPRDFKKRHGEKRNLLKTCTLALLYGMTVSSLAKRLGVSECRARNITEEFLDMFPTLRQYFNEEIVYCRMQKYIIIVSGLKIHLDSELPGNVLSRMCRNYPIQGSAAVIFKSAGNELDKLYQEIGARLLIPLHDSFVFEAPEEIFQHVAELTRNVMCNTVAKFYPCLKQKADINIETPKYWSKDGHPNAAQNWIKNGKI